MMSSRQILVLIALVVGCSVVPTANGLIENYEEKWNMTIQQMTSPPSSGDVSAKALSCQGIQFNTSDGTCKLEPRPAATSAHLLTPADIGVVAAIGDSITAAFGARSSGIFDSPFREARGVSWSIGGDGQSYSDCTTIPNILKSFNPNVYGASTGYGSDGALLNRAISGAESKDILEQAEALVNMIPEDKQDEWKLVTLWIGGNDLCRRCSTLTGEQFKDNILDTVRYLKEKLTKTLVSIPQVLDVTKITKATGITCGLARWIACDCANKDGTSALAEEYMDALDELDNLPELNNGDDFAVVIQPFFREVELPLDGKGNVDMSFFAPDCFHMSVKGHRAIAAALWSNMVNEENNKEGNWDPYNPTLECPDPAHPYFYTSRTQSLLDAQAQSGGFNAQSEPDPNEDGQDNSGWSLGQIFGVAIGSAATSYLVVAVVVGMIVWARRRRHQASPNSEIIPLVKKL